MWYKNVLLGVLTAVALAAVVAYGVGGNSQAAPPPGQPQEAHGTTITLPYAGQLSDSQGEPVAAGAYDFTFALYATETGGSPLWKETQEGAPVRGGLFRVQLGSVTGIPVEALAPGGAWLSVAVRSGVEEDFTTLAPRQRVQGSVAAGALESDTAGLTCPHDHMGEQWTAADGDQNGLTIWTALGYSLLGWSNSSIGLAGISQPTRYELPDGSYGVYGYSNDDHGVYGVTDGNWSWHSGVYGEASQDNANGVTGWNTGAGPGVYAYGKSGTALYAISDGPRGVYAARITSEDGHGLYAASGAPFGYAAYFSGDVTVTGNLSKPGGGFKIDHPLDPENQYLNHSFVESPDMKNLYDGVVVLDGEGAAWVDLPEWFEALNKDFRYQLTPIGAPAPDLYIAQEVEDNRFRIAGGESGLKVSWQLSGIRHDDWADTHPLLVEQEKPPEERGRYMFPDDLGKSRTQGLEYRRNRPSGQSGTGAGS